MNEKESLARPENSVQGDKKVKIQRFSIPMPINSESQPEERRSLGLNFEKGRQKNQQMEAYIWHKVAALSGMAALGLGTYGFHVFKPEDPTYTEVWQTASLYHLVHSAALLAAPITKHPKTFGGLLTAGILLFSGTCYIVAFFEDRKYSTLAPFGGFAFIGAWASLFF